MTAIFLMWWNPGSSDMREQHIPLYSACGWHNCIYQTTDRDAKIPNTPRQYTMPTTEFGVAAELSIYPGYFREPHWKSMGLPEISRVTWQLCGRRRDIAGSRYQGLLTSTHTGGGTAHAQSPRHPIREGERITRLVNMHWETSCVMDY